MEKVLIANRGEIAVRVIRACRDAGLLSVAVYSDQDREAPHARLADDAYALGGSTAADTYLNAEKILDAAARSGADAVHPGYGFLSEDAAFARAVLAAGLIWIGPPPDAIDRLGDKVAAREIARRVSAPLAPGTRRPVSGPGEVLEFARRFGLPLAIKAANGGGGRGLKVAYTPEEIPDLLESAVREAAAAFGRGDCFVEKYLDRARHVETQCLADLHGNVVVLSTRDCTLQRRHQKLVEEAPAPFLTDQQERTLVEASKAILAEAGYTGAGTCEFLLGEDGTISFLEVNTRLQVEHPVTEEVTGVDLVLEQFRMAVGEPLRLTDLAAVRGHAMEFRVNGEDVGRGFLPTPGTVTRWRTPGGPGVRVDTGIEEGSVVDGAFDSLLAKLVVSGRDRRQVLARARRALAEFEVEGVPTTLKLCQALLDAPEFAAPGAAGGLGVHTRWLETDAPLQLEPWEPAVEGPGPGFAARRANTLRYGENPHQHAALYVDPAAPAGLAQATQLAGKEMSYNNYVDADAAWRACHDFSQPCVAIIKHANPCGIAIGADVAEAHRKAHACDPVSAFGGVIAVNGEVTLALAEQISGIFTEAVIAPSYADGAVEVLSHRKNLRILVGPKWTPATTEFRRVSGGLLTQTVDRIDAPGDGVAAWTLVAGSPASEQALRDLEFAWRAVRSVKSNAILLASGGATVGVGMGQVNRVDSARLAVARAGERAAGSVAASDAFFPFADGLEVLIEAGISAVAEPGGSIRDEEVVAAAKAAGLTLYFTGTRHFFH